MVYETLAIVAALIGLYALVAGKLSTTPINGALVFALMGLCLGPAGLGWVTFELEASHLRLVAEMALALVLFIDASKADLGVLRQSEAIPRRLILRSLPLVMVLGWLFGIVLLPGLSWVEVALLAALLAPTDAALGQAVVSNKSVPAHLREGLSFESGLNDGVCVPFFLTFLAVATGVATDDVGRFALKLLIEEVGRGALMGGAVAVLGALALRVALPRGWVGHGWSQILIAAMAVTAFSGAMAIHGSGFIAAFVGGLVFGQMARDEIAALKDASESLSDGLSLITWVIFGAAVMPIALQNFTWMDLVYALMSLTVVRMLPVLVTLGGLGLSLKERLFIGWFGPRGLASVVFLVMVSNENLPGGPQIMTVGILTISLSVLLHGITARPFSQRMA